MRSTVLERRVDDNRVADVEARDARPQVAHDAGAVCAEDARLGHGGQAPADPDVETVDRCGPQLDENLAGPGHGIGRFLQPEHVGAAVVVDAYGQHGGGSYVELVSVRLRRGAGTMAA